MKLLPSVSFGVEQVQQKRAQQRITVSKMLSVHCTVTRTVLKSVLDGTTEAVVSMIYQHQLLMWLC